MKCYFDENCCLVVEPENVIENTRLDFWIKYLKRSVPDPYAIDEFLDVDLRDAIGGTPSVTVDVLSCIQCIFPRKVSE